MYTVILQGQGKDKPETPIKKLGKIPGKDKNGKERFFPVKFPILKVVVQHNNGLGQFEILWSHTTKNEKGDDYLVTTNPGTFRVKLTRMMPVIIHVRNPNGRIAKDLKGQDMIDYLAMEKQWGSTYNYATKEMTFSADHPLEKRILSEQTFETITGFRDAITKKFGVAVANQILDLYLSHETFQKYLDFSKAA